MISRVVEVNRILTTQFVVKMEEFAHVLKLHGEPLSDAEVKQLTDSLSGQREADIDGKFHRF